MNKLRTILDPEILDPDVKTALDVLGTRDATQEAIDRSLKVLRRALINAKPTIAGKDIVLAVSELSKALGTDSKLIASVRMRSHMVARRELKSGQPKP